MRVCLDRVHLAYVCVTLSRYLAMRTSQEQSLRSLRQGAFIGLRSVIHVSPTPVECYGVLLVLVSYHTTTSHFFTFAVAFHFLVYSGGLLDLILQSFECFRYPHEIICKHQSRHRIFPHRDSMCCCFNCYQYCHVINNLE